MVEIRLYAILFCLCRNGECFSDEMEKLMNIKKSWMTRINNFRKKRNLIKIEIMEVGTKWRALIIIQALKLNELVMIRTSISNKSKWIYTLTTFWIKRQRRISKLEQIIKCSFNLERQRNQWSWVCMAFNGNEWDSWSDTDRDAVSACPVRTQLTANKIQQEDFLFFTSLIKGCKRIG